MFSIQAISAASAAPQTPLGVAAPCLYSSSYGAGPGIEILTMESGARLLRLSRSDAPIKAVLFGDIHGKWGAARDIMDHEFPDQRGLALCTGDLCTYPQLDHDIIFVHGNHESYEAIRELHRECDPNNRLWPLFAGDIVELGGLTVAGLPGVYSQHFWEHPADAPIKYFTADSIAALKAIDRPVDILLSHDAPSGVGFEKKGMQLGNPHIADAITALDPALAVFGHHHIKFIGKAGSTVITGLDYPNRSYVLMEIEPAAGRMRLTERVARISEDRKVALGYKYDWSSSNNGDIRTLFDERVPMGGEKKFYKRLDGELREQMSTALSRYLLDSGVKEKFAKDRAGLALNTAIPFAASYANSLAISPDLTIRKRQEILLDLHAKMMNGLLPEAISDVLLAFNECLRALGLVKQ